MTNITQTVCPECGHESMVERSATELVLESAEIERYEKDGNTEYHMKLVGPDDSTLLELTEEQYDHLKQVLE